MPRKSKNSGNHYGGFDILSSTTTPISTVTTPILTGYNPFSYKSTVPVGIDYLVKKDYLYPNPYYPDASLKITNYDDISTVISSEDEYGNIKNTIITQPIFRDPYDTSFITSWHPDYIHPMLSTYRDLNSDPVMRKKITKYFITHVLDKWINREMSDVLNYLEVDNNGNVSIIKNLNNYDPNSYKKDSNRDIENKIKFLEKYILTFEVVHKILSKYVKETGVQWVNLPSQKYYIRRIIEKKMLRLLKNAISEIRNR